MARFYFHVWQGNTVFEERRGGELPNLPAAWAGAMHEARGLVQDGDLDLRPEDCWIEIVSETGDVVASLPFERLLHLN